MTATQTPPEPTRTRRTGIIIALIVAAIVMVTLVVIILLVAVVGMIFVTPTGSSGGPEPVVVTVPAVAVPDGEMFVYLTSIEGDSVVVDPARMLTGREARQAAEADGVISPDEDLPNDFYIDNPDTEATELGVTDDVEVTVLVFGTNGGITEADIALSDLATAFTGDYSGHPIYGLTAGEFPTMITVEGGRVAEIAQVYLP